MQRDSVIAHSGLCAVYKKCGIHTSQKDPRNLMVAFSWVFLLIIQTAKCSGGKRNGLFQVNAVICKNVG